MAAGAVSPWIISVPEVQGQAAPISSLIAQLCGPESLITTPTRSPGEEMAGLKSPDGVYPESECQVPLVGLMVCSEGNFLLHRVLRVF